MLTITSFIITTCYGVSSTVATSPRLLFVHRHRTRIIHRYHASPSFLLPMHWSLKPNGSHEFLECEKSRAASHYDHRHFWRNHRNTITLNSFPARWIPARLYSSNSNSNDDENGNEHHHVEQRDEHDNDWKVPSNIHIPIHELDLTFARSSGAGGQNVNKVETQVVLKLHLDSALWIPAEVRRRIQQNEQNRINKEGYLVLSSQEHRTQYLNRNQVVDKLKEIILKHYARPKERTVRKVGSFTTKERQRKREEKKRQSITKENRRKVDF